MKVEEEVHKNKSISGDERAARTALSFQLKLIPNEEYTAAFIHELDSCAHTHETHVETHLARES
jgi:hypothetical protein